MCLGAVGLGLIASQASSCSPLPIYRTVEDKNILTVPFSAFVEEKNMLIVRDTNMDFDILVLKKADGNYSAMLMKCTHQDNPLTANANGFFCASHGSTYNLDGEVTKEPALTPLKKYKIELNNTSILIHTQS